MITPIVYVILSFLPAGFVALAHETWNYFKTDDKRAPIKDKMVELSILTPTAPVLSAAEIRKIAFVLSQKCRDVEF